MRIPVLSNETSRISYREHDDENLKDNLEMRRNNRGEPKSKTFLYKLVPQKPACVAPGYPALSETSGPNPHAKYGTAGFCKSSTKTTEKVNFKDASNVDTQNLRILPTRVFPKPAHPGVSQLGPIV